jgi:hypothetical protein
MLVGVGAGTLGHKARQRPEWIMLDEPDHAVLRI